MDATTLCEPGAKGTSWRLHVGYDLMAGQVDQLTLTDDRGAESLSRFVCRPGDIVLADRGYAKARDLRPVIDAGADFITRMGWNALHLLRPDGAAFDLFGALAMVLAGSAEVQVAVDERLKGTVPLGLRLVIIRKSEADAARAQAEVRRSASKRCQPLDPRSLEAAEICSAADLTAGLRISRRARRRAVPPALANRVGVQTLEKPGWPGSLAGQGPGAGAPLDLCQADRRPPR